MRAAAGPEPRVAARTRSSLPAIAAIMAFVLVSALLALRLDRKLNTPGNPDTDRWGLIDFRDQIYFPVVAVLEGRNPYDQASYTQAYPVERVFAPYTPLSLLVHLPLGLLPLAWAQRLYALLNLGLVLALAALTLRLCGAPATAERVFGIGTLVLLSRPGHWNFMLGQFAAAAAVATYIALYFARSRPWLAACGLAFTTFKPSFGGPLALLMLARRDGRAVAYGVGIAAAVQAAGTALVIRAAGGLSPFLASLQAGFASWKADSTVNAATSAFRVDIVGIVGHALGVAPDLATELTIALCAIAAGALAVRRLEDPRAVGGAGALSAVIVCLVVVTSVYHLAYDLLLLTLPFAAILDPRCAAACGAGRKVRWALIALLTLPAVNYAASGTAIDHLGISGRAWTLVTSLNGVALLLALALFLMLAFRRAA